jgi:hypothetical protein
MLVKAHRTAFDSSTVRGLIINLIKTNQKHIRLVMGAGEGASGHFQVSRAIKGLSLSIS